MTAVENTLGSLKLNNSERSCALCDAHNSKCCDLTDTIDIRFEWGYKDENNNMYRRD